MDVPKEYAKAIARYGPKIDKLAQSKYGVSGEALLAKLLAGESGFSMSAVSSAGARAAAQFMPTSRQAVIDFTNGKIDPWRSPAEAVAGAVIHLKGKLGNATGLEGYNPGGGQAYVNYILSQNVNGIPDAGDPASLKGAADAGAGAASIKVGSGRLVAKTTPPQVTTSLPLRPLQNPLAPDRPSATPTMPAQAIGGGAVLSYGGAPNQQVTPGETKLVQEGGKFGTEVVPGGAVPASKSANSLVSWAEKQIGTAEGSSKQVAWANQIGISPAEPWCSVFVAAALLQAGVKNIPPSAAYSGAWLSWEGGTQISTKQMQPGDIVVFDWGDGGRTDHVAIYAGDGMVVGGNQSNGVSKVPLNSGAIVGVVRPDGVTQQKPKRKKKK